MRDINTFLPFWEGFSVVTIKPEGDALRIELTPHATRFPSCGGCQKPCSTTHEYCERTVRDLPILGRAVRLSVLLRRVGCRDCGKRMEAVSWLDRYARMTRRLADAVNRLRHDKPARKVIKQARWLLLRNPQNLKTPEQQVRLQDLLAANQSLMTVYLMKAELKTLWTPSAAWAWRSAWKQWLRHAHESEIPALIQFAKRLKAYWRGIVSRVRWPMHTGQLEGINNRIKVIKRMAYGYRDSEFVFMKIKSVFPGNP